MDKKLIFLDIDGTLTEPGKNTPPDSAVNAIRRAQEKGHLVFLCTGRNFGMLRPLLKYGFDGLVGCSGGYVEYRGQTVYDAPMSNDERDMVMDCLKRNGIFRTIECRDNSYTDEGLKLFLEANQTDGANSELLRWRRQVESSLNIRPMAEYPGSPAYKLVFMCTAEKQLKEPKELLGKNFNICIQEMDRFGIINGELIPRTYDKGQAVRRMAEFLNVPIEDTIGFGDSMNDLEMMETVGMSVCMDNGARALKEISDIICPGVTEDGLFKAFSELGLI